MHFTEPEAILYKVGMADTQQSLRNIRIVHFAFLAAPAVLFFALSTIPITRKGEPSFLPMVLAVLAFGEVGIATAVRNKTIRPAVERLRSSPQDLGAMAQWLRGNLLSFVFAMTVALY